MAVAGIDITAVLESAIFSLRNSTSVPRKILRGSMLLQDKSCTSRENHRILACYEPSFRYMAEWWKQLFGESEGKNGIGIFPASVEYTADLHSMGQYIQDGPRHLLETVMEFEHSTQLLIPKAPEGTDAFDTLTGMDFGSVNRTVSKQSQLHTSRAVFPTFALRFQERMKLALQNWSAFLNSPVPSADTCCMSIHLISPVWKPINPKCIIFWNRNYRNFSCFLNNL